MYLLPAHTHAYTSDLSPHNLATLAHLTTRSLFKSSSSTLLRRAIASSPSRAAVSCTSWRSLRPPTDGEFCRGGGDTCIIISVQYKKDLIRVHVHKQRTVYVIMKSGHTVFSWLLPVLYQAVLAVDLMSQHPVFKEGVLYILYTYNNITLLTLIGRLRPPRSSPSSPPSGRLDVLPWLDSWRFVSMGYSE